MVDPSLTRMSDGRVMCCICYGIRWPNELLVDGNGIRWDVCAAGTCAAQAGYRDGLFPEDRGGEAMSRDGPRRYGPEPQPRGHLTRTARAMTLHFTCHKCNETEFLSELPRRHKCRGCGQVYQFEEATYGPAQRHDVA